MIRSLFFSLLFLANFVVAEEQEHQCKILLLAPLSGVLASVGSDFRDGALLAVEREKPSFSLVAEDDGYDPKRSVALFQRFAADKNLCGVVSFGSGTSIALSRLTVARSIPQLTIAMSKEPLKAGSSVAQLHIPSYEQGKALADRMRELRLHSVALATFQNDAMLAVKAAFEKHFNGEVLVDEEMLPQDTDLRSLALKIKQSGAEAVLILGFGPPLPVLARSLREHDFTGEIGSSSALQNPELIEAAPNALEGAWLSAHRENPKTERFYKNFEKQFSRDPMAEASYGYDAIVVMDHMLRQRSARTADPWKFEAEFDSVLGKYKLLPDRTFTVPVGLKIVRGGTFVPHEIVAVEK